MKVGINVLLWTAAATEEHLPLLQRVRDWGYDSVEFPMFQPQGSPWKLIGAWLDELRLHRTAVTIVSPEANPISESPARRRAGIDHLKACVDSCVDLGAPVLCGPLTAPVGRLVGRGPVQQEWDWAVEGVREAAEHAEAAGVTLALEALNRFETYFLTCVADALRFAEAVDHPAVGLMFDTFHANIEEKDPLAALRSAGPRLVHFHVSENDRGTPGEGHVPWPEVFRTLRGTGYDGCLTVEAFGRALPEVAAATSIWRDMMPSEEHLASRTARFIREGWQAAAAQAAAPGSRPGSDGGC